MCLRLHQNMPLSFSSQEPDVPYSDSTRKATSYESATTIGKKKNTVIISPWHPIAVLPHDSSLNFLTLSDDYDNIKSHNIQYTDNFVRQNKIHPARPPFSSSLNMPNHLSSMYTFRGMSI